MDVDKGGSMHAIQMASECLRKPEIKRVRIQFYEDQFKEYVKVFCCHINWNDIAGEHMVMIPCGNPEDWNIRYRCIKKCLLHKNVLHIAAMRLYFWEKVIQFMTKRLSSFRAGEG